jgi:LDH2 family malate/lactate/ureidoglycolate dehydrogenase
VYVAGDIERIIEGERMKNGIPLVAEVVADLKALGSKLNLHL